MNREMMLAVKDRFSALADGGNFLKMVSVQPAGMSASNIFEQSLSTQSRPSTCSEAAVRFPPQQHQQQSALFQQRLELLNRYRLAKQIPLEEMAAHDQELLSMCCRFHPFSNNVHAQALSHGNNG